MNKLQATKVNTSRLKAPGEVTINFCYKRYISGAKRRNLTFDLNLDDFRSITQQNCMYCGQKPRPYSVYEVKDQNASPETKKRSYVNYNGIDRIDSNVGYNLKNCVPCCYTCNIAKHNMSIDDFQKWISNVYTNFIQGKE